MLALTACQGQAMDGDFDSGVTPRTDIPYAAPRPRYTEQPSLAVPDGITTLGAVAVHAPSGRVFVAAGSRVLRADALATATDARLALHLDLATTAGVSSIGSMVVYGDDGLAVTSGSTFLTLSLATGAVRTRTDLSPAASIAGIAVTPDGRTGYAVEGLRGSDDGQGGNAVHVMVVPLDPTVTSGVTRFTLTSPFELVPSEVSFTNAGAVTLAPDGAALWVSHIVTRLVYRVALAPPYTVTTVDTDSLQRSATTMVVGSDGLMTQCATFDQTVPVFDVSSGATARVVAEIPVGLTPQGAATFQRRVFVSEAAGAGFGGFVMAGDGGTQPSLDGGGMFLFDAAALMGMGMGMGMGTGDAGAGTPPRVRVYTLSALTDP